MKLVGRVNSDKQEIYAMNMHAKIISRYKGAYFVGSFAKSDLSGAVCSNIVLLFLLIT